MKHYKKRIEKNHKCPEWASLSIAVGPASLAFNTLEVRTVMLPLNGTTIELEMFFGKLYIRASTVK